MWPRGLKYSDFRARHAGDSRGLCGLVDWNTLRKTANKPNLRRGLCGLVDWNKSSFKLFLVHNSRGLCGLVDWNIPQQHDGNYKGVEAYVASWIEIYVTGGPVLPGTVEAYVASWIEIADLLISNDSVKVEAYVASWIEMR